MEYTKSEVLEGLIAFDTRIDYTILYDNNIVYEAHTNENEGFVVLFMEYGEPEIEFNDIDPSDFEFFKNIDIEITDIHDLSKAVKKAQTKDIVFDKDGYMVNVEDIESFEFFEENDMYDLKVYERKELNSKALLREIKKVQNEG